MANVLMISATRLIETTALNGSIDNDLIHPYILLAQDKYILPVLGTDLYEKLKSDISGSSVAGNYQTLLETYVQPALQHFAFGELLPYLRLRFVNHSIVAMSSENGSAITYDELKPLIDRAIHNGEYYRQRLVDYLVNNTSLFSEYNSNSGADMNPTTENYTSGLNIYGTTPPLSNKQKAILQASGITTINFC